jgi:N6-L-threonylcarbamoyladenine synthase
MKILGIETSCDETAASVVCDDKNYSQRLLSNVIVSQIKDHQKYGGVVPEIAARSHLYYLPRVVQKALDDAGTTFADIDYLAVTAGPGLIGGVFVGVLFAKGLSFSLNKPCYGINHLQGHALVPRMLNDIDFPFLLLLVSGGHCQFLKVSGVQSFELLGETIDDSIGEAFDKTAKMMGHPYPGGPEIEKLALLGDENAFDLPRPLYHEKNANFSFSGLKTAVKNIVDKNQPISLQFKQDMAASFQRVVGDVLVKKTKFILNQHHLERFVVAGGVAANQYLKKRLTTLCIEKNIQLFTPPINLCTDNAAMIGWAGIEQYNAGILPTDFQPKSRWPLY